MKALLAFLLLTTGFTHAADLPFTLDKPGNVSAAIYDAQGRMLRELARAEPMTAGTHTLVWDGLDKHGVAQVPGGYTWKVLSSPGLEAKFLRMVGITTVELPYHRLVGTNDGLCAESPMKLARLTAQCWARQDINAAWNAVARSPLNATKKQLMFNELWG